MASPTPQDVQDQIAQAEALLLKTKTSGSGMLNRYGQSAAWPQSTLWAQAWAKLAAASAEAGQLVAPPAPPVFTVTITGTPTVGQTLTAMVV